MHRSLRLSTQAALYEQPSAAPEPGEGQQAAAGARSSSLMEVPREFPALHCAAVEALRLALVDDDAFRCVAHCIAL